MQQILPILTAFMLGVLITANMKCSKEIVTQSIVQHDTLTISQRDTVTEFTPVYKYKVNVKRDSFYIPVVKDFVVDSVKTDSVTGEVKVYVDSMNYQFNQGDVKFNYELHTLGDLLMFSPSITFLPLTTNSLAPTVQSPTYKEVKKLWTLGIGLSNRLVGKLSFGYKDILLEPALDFQNKNFQVFFTKQFHF